MDSYFIRHTKTMSVEDSDLDEIWNQDKIAIHFPGDGEEDFKSLDPNDYRKPSERQAIRCFQSLQTTADMFGRSIVRGSTSRLAR